MASWKKLLTSGTVTASDVVSGTLATARIPSLNASKITSGTIADARLPGECGARTTYDNYSSFKAASSAFDSGGQITSGTKLTIQGGSNVTTSRSGSAITINGTADTNTTYSAGNAITLSGTTFSIADEAITGTEIEANTIESGHLTQECINHGSLISNDVIDSQHYNAGSIDNEHLANLAVTQGKIADGAVTGTKLQTYAVSSSSKLNSNVVTESKINNNAVTPAKANLGWHTQTKIFVPPSDFMVNDDQNYGNLALMDSGGQAKVMYAVHEAYANVPIPSGYKVTHWRVNGTGSITVTLNYSTVAVGTTVSCQAPAQQYTNTTNVTNPTSGVTADDTNGRYIVIGWFPGNVSTYLYGAVLTIAKV